MSEAQMIDFTAIWQKVETARLDAAAFPTVWGGAFTSPDSNAFLKAWFESNLALPWRVWEHTDAIAWGRIADSRPERPAHLLRAELFGPDGHLSLRRDGAKRWQWRFVGCAGASPPADVKGEPWQTDANMTLFRYAEKVILWGKEVRQDENDPQSGVGLWWEDRVAAARLAYPPHLSGIERVYLHFYRYTQAGRTVLVQYRGLGDETTIHDAFLSE